MGTHYGSDVSYRVIVEIVSFFSFLNVISIIVNNKPYNILNIGFVIGKL